MAKKRRSSQFKESSQVIDIEEARRKRQEKRLRQQQKEQAEAEAARKRVVRASVLAKRRKKNIIYAVVILAIIAAIGVSALNIVTLRADYKAVEAENLRLQEEKEQLEKQLENSGKKDFIEEEARRQLRMVKPGETVYIVPFGEETVKEEENGKNDN